MSFEFYSNNLSRKLTEIDTVKPMLFIDFFFFWASITDVRDVCKEDNEVWKYKPHPKPSDFKLSKREYQRLQMLTGQYENMYF